MNATDLLEIVQPTDPLLLLWGTLRDLAAKTDGHEEGCSCPDCTAYQDGLAEFRRRFLRCQ